MKSALDGTLFGLTAGATWFHNDIEDLIAPDLFFTTSINIGKARTEGAEVFVGWQPLERSSLRADYSFTESVDETTSLALLRRPDLQGQPDRNGWIFRPDPDLSATLLYVGPWIDGSRDFSTPRLKTEGHVTVNLAARWQATEMFALFARGDNLFDEAYQNPVGFLGPERAFYVGVQAKL